MKNIENVFGRKDCNDWFFTTYLLCLVKKRTCYTTICSKFHRCSDNFAVNESFDTNGYFPFDNNSAATVVVIAKGKFEQVLCYLMQRSLRISSEWCPSVRLIIISAKTMIGPYTTK